VTTLAVGTDSFSVFGTTATLLVSEPGRVADARAIADDELTAVDLACSPASSSWVLAGGRCRTRAIACAVLPRAPR